MRIITLTSIVSIRFENSQKLRNLLGHLIVKCLPTLTTLTTFRARTRRYCVNDGNGTVFDYRQPNRCQERFLSSSPVLASYVCNNNDINKQTRTKRSPRSNYCCCYVIVHVLRLGGLILFLSLFLLVTHTARRLPLAPSCSWDEKKRHDNDDDYARKTIARRERETAGQRERDTRFRPGGKSNEQVWWLRSVIRQQAPTLPLRLLL